MQDIIEEITRAIKENKKEKPTKAYIKDYTPELISEKNFHKLSEEKSKQKIAFVDGGNSEVIGTPNTSLQLIRVYYNVFQDNKKILGNKKEFYALTTAVANDKEIMYKTKIIGKETEDYEELVIDSNNPEIKEGQNKASISKIGEIVRKMAEWQACKEAMTDLEEGDCIVKDGTLDIDYSEEEKCASESIEIAAQKGVTLAGLAKTSKIFCDNGQIINEALAEMTNLPEWNYSPVVKEKNIHYIKLNKNSKHNFRLDIEGNVQELLKLLRQNANEATFPGYPYGLIEADAMARVTNQEKEYLLVKIKTLLGKDWKKIENQMNTQNAHQILDTIS